MVKLNILCVDDRFEIRMLLQEVFKEDYNVEVAGSGKEALNITKEFIPQIAIIDMNLDDMKGTELIRELKKVNKNIKSIIVTGEDDFKNENEYIVFKKPFNIFELKEKTKELSKNYEI